MKNQVSEKRKSFVKKKKNDPEKIIQKERNQKLKKEKTKRGSSFPFRTKQEKYF